MEIEKLFEDKDFSDLVNSVQTMIEATTILSSRYSFHRVMKSINDLLEITEKFNSKDKFTNDQKTYFNKCVIRGLCVIKKELMVDDFLIEEEINYMDNSITKVIEYCK